MEKAEKIPAKSRMRQIAEECENDVRNLVSKNVVAAGGPLPPQDAACQGVATVIEKAMRRYCCKQYPQGEVKGVSYQYAAKK